MEPLLLYVDAVTVPVPDLDRGLAFYRDLLGHELIWRNDTVGQVGLRAARSETEIVLSTGERYEPDWKVADPFGNRLVALDSIKGTYDTDASGAVSRVSRALSQAAQRPAGTSGSFAE